MINNTRIEHIINNFDFNKVRKVMIFLNWTWCGSVKAPSISELKNTALKLLTNVENSKYRGYICHSTGGFNASKVPNSDSLFGYDLCLDFTIESWEE